MAVQQPKRLGALAVVAVACYMLLGARLYFLQVIDAVEFEQAATSNRIREIYTEARRGSIYDAKGRLLAGSRESLVVTLNWTELRELKEAERRAVYEKLAEPLNDAGFKVKIDDLEDNFNRAQNGSLKPVVVVEDVGEELWVTILEMGLPGFTVERRWVRTYPYGPVAAQILGYIGSVLDTEEAEELNEEAGAKRYFAGDDIGRSGLEALFELDLRGTPSRERVEVNATNRIVGTVETLQAGGPGNDVHLAIDIDLQWAAEEILAQELAAAKVRKACKDCVPHRAEAGSLVAVDARNGSVVALASLPTYDPSAFVFGLTQEQSDFIFRREPAPFVNRAVAGQYPAASTFKLVTGYTAVDTGLRDPDFLWDDQGFLDIENCEAGCRFRNAGDAVMGLIDLRAAIERSSDTYFYRVGELLWVEQDQYGETALQDVAEDFGFGQKTGIQLPGERAGAVPTPERRREAYDANPDLFLTGDWRTGDNVNLSVGQGDLLITPLQLANAYASFGQQGLRFQPRLVDRIMSSDGAVLEVFEPVVARDEPLNEQAYSAISVGLRRVPLTGTASEAFTGFPLDQYPLAGKTGTAEVQGKADFSLYVGYGPLPSADYAVAAILEEAGFGGDAAAPAVRRFFELLVGLTPIPTAPLAGEPAPILSRPDIQSSTGDVEPTDDELDGTGQTTTTAGATGGSGGAVTPSTTAVVPAEPGSGTGEEPTTTATSETPSTTQPTESTAPATTAPTETTAATEPSAPEETEPEAADP